MLALALWTAGSTVTGAAIWGWWRRRVPKGARRVVAYEKGAPIPMWVVPVGNGQYLEREAAEQLRKLMQAAEEAGHRLSVTSGFRFQEEQEELYRRYLAGTGNRAARPGYSDHQRGLSADLGGVGSYSSTAYAWLARNAAQYGFENDVPSEHWHWTYTRGKRTA